MINVVIWGAGRYCETVINAVKKEFCKIQGIADSNQALHRTKFMNTWIIDSPENLIDDETDFIIISAQYSSQILQYCELLNINKIKIIDYWRSDEKYYFIDANVKKIFELEEKVETLRCHLQNMPYELGLLPSPVIRSAEELMKKVIEDKISLSRFGDGELEIMQQRERPWFQVADAELSARLKEVFRCKDERIIIALSDNFGNLDRYTEVSADGIRKYLSNGIREKLMEAIDMTQVYYDASVTRPYLMNKDKRYAQRIFEMFKCLWRDRDILLVEGSKSYIGIRNDLFESAKKIRRIIAPCKNAFSVYDKILDSVKQYADENTLVLCSLGPTATVLAYDLAMAGIQTIDIGQLDNEYEWYLRGADEAIEVPGKCVAGLGQHYEVQIIEDEEYKKQIVDSVI